MCAPSSSPCHRARPCAAWWRELIARHPALGPLAVDAAGALLPHIHVFVNGRDATYLHEGVDTARGLQDTMDIFPAVAGGSHS